MKKLYSFYADFHRGGCIEAIFIAEEEDVAKAVGKEAYFGEVLGKHSEVRCELEASDFKVLSENPSDLEVIERLGIHTFGYNPLKSIREDEDEDE